MWRDLWGASTNFFYLKSSIDLYSKYFRPPVRLLSPTHWPDIGQKTLVAFNIFNKSSVGDTFFVVDDNWLFISQ